MIFGKYSTYILPQMTSKYGNVIVGYSVSLQKCALTE